MGGLFISSCLTSKRDRIEKMSKQTLEQLHEGMKTNIYSSHMSSDIDFLYPKNVTDAYNKFMEAKADNPENVNDKFAFYEVAREMKRSLSDIENEISSLLD